MSEDDMDELKRDLGKLLCWAISDQGYDGTFAAEFVRHIEALVDAKIAAALEKRDT